MKKDCAPRSSSSVSAAAADYGAKRSEGLLARSRARDLVSPIANELLNAPFLDVAFIVETVIEHGPHRGNLSRHELFRNTDFVKTALQEHLTDPAHIQLLDETIAGWSTLAEEVILRASAAHQANKPIPEAVPAPKFLEKQPMAA